MCHSCLLSLPLVCCLGFSAEVAVGQSLSISATNANQLSVQVSVPLDNQGLLQESGDLQSWTNVNNDVFGRLEYLIQGPGQPQQFYRLITWTPPLNPITIVQLGNSTSMDYPNPDGSGGWGIGIHRYFNTNVLIVNLAWPCFSTTAFLASEQKTKMLLIKPDYVFVEFGQSDAWPCAGQTNYGTTLPQFADNLKALVQMIRDFNGTPILITPTAPRAFDANGKIIPELQDRCAVVKEVATETQTYLLDLNKLTMNLYNQLGPTESEILAPPGDVFHFSANGTIVIAGVAAHALPPSLQAYLVK